MIRIVRYKKLNCWRLARCIFSALHGSYLYLFVFILISSCVKDSPVVEQLPDTIVVNCILTKSNTQTLTLSYCSKLGKGNYYKEATEASVELFEDNTSVGSFIKNGYATWQLHFVPKTEKVYRLEVSVPGFEKISATTLMPHSPNAKKLVAKDDGYNRNLRQYKSLFSCWIFALNSIAQFPDTIIPEPAHPSVSDKLIDLIGTDCRAADKFNQDGNLADLLPNADLPAYRYYIRINSFPESIDSTDFRLQTTFYPVSFIIIRTASAEYDQYLKSSLQKMSLYANEDDPVKWFDENKIYSNITNGVGIFAAYSDQVLYYNSFLPVL